MQVTQISFHWENPYSLTSLTSQTIETLFHKCINFLYILKSTHPAGNRPTSLSFTHSMTHYIKYSHISFSIHQKLFHVKFKIRPKKSSSEQSFSSKAKGVLQPPWIYIYIISHMPGCWYDVQPRTAYKLAFAIFSINTILAKQFV